MLLSLLQVGGVFFQDGSFGPSAARDLGWFNSKVCGKQVVAPWRRSLPVNRSDLVQRLAAEADITERDADIALNAMLDAIVSALKEGDRIELRGFGGFSVRRRKARQARNPKTGAAVQVAEKHVPHFKVGAPLLKALNGDPEALADIQFKRERQRRRRDGRHGQVHLF